MKLRSLDAVPASVEQEQFWLLEALNPGSAAYNEDFAFHIKGELSPTALEDALRRMVDRNPILRTRLRMYDGRLWQEVVPQPDIGLRRLEARSFEEIQDWARALVEEPFSLTEGPLVRYGLARLGEKRSIFVMAHHHAVSDLASFVIHLREVGTLYSGGDLDGQVDGFHRFATWQRANLDSGAWEGELAAWAADLVGAPEFVEVPTCRPRPPVKGTSGGLQVVPFGDDVVGRLREVAARERVTPLHVLLGAFVAVLRRYSGQDDLVLGVANDGRPASFRGSVGPFARIMPIRFRPAGNSKTGAVLREVRDTTLAAMGREPVPLSSLAGATLPRRDLCRTPLVQIIFNFAPIRYERDVLVGASLKRYHVPRTRSRFDLFLNLEWDEVPKMVWEYDTALYDGATIRRLAAGYSVMLDCLFAGADAEVDAVPLPDLHSVAPNTVPESAPPVAKIPDHQSRPAGGRAHPNHSLPVRGGRRGPAGR